MLIWIQDLDMNHFGSDRERLIRIANWYSKDENSVQDAQLKPVIMSGSYHDTVDNKTIAT